MANTSTQVDYQLLIRSSISAAAMLVIHHMIKRTRKKLASMSDKTPFDNVPMIPNPHPIVGHMIMETKNRILHQIPTLSIRTLRKYSKNGLSSTWFMNTKMLLVIDPIAANTVLQSNTRRVLPKFIQRHFKKAGGEKNFLILNGKEWRMYRNAVHKCMTPTFLKDYQLPMCQCAYKLTRSLIQKIQITGATNGANAKIFEPDITKLMKMITMDVFLLVSIGLDLKSCETLTTSKVAKYFEENTHDLTRRLMTHPFRPWNYFYTFPSIDNYKRYCRKLYLMEVIGKPIQEKRDERKRRAKDSTGANGTLGTGERKKQDMLSNYLDAQEKSNEDENLNMSNEDLIGLLTTLIFAGYDTTSIMLTYCLYLISTRPDIEASLVEEARSVIGHIKYDDSDCDGNGMGDFDVEKLVLCKAVIEETLRLYPIAIKTGRTILKGSKVEVNGLVFEGPFMCRVPIFAIQRDPNNFPQPDDFLPERWVRKVDKANEWVERRAGDDCDEEKDWASKHAVPPANRVAFFAFSSGARSCVGRRFAYQEAIIALAILIKDLKFEVEEGYECIPQRYGAIQSPKFGMPMYISQRL
jgi:cytochrome P450